MSPERQPSRAERIAQLNDDFRRRGPVKDWVATRGVLTLPDIPGLIQAVRTFDTFTPDNDPYGEHDFGSIQWQSETTYWKIDYYDQQLQYGDDPLSPDCRRVLTVMLASEY